jgi:ornithine cyclodeaminase
MKPAIYTLGQINEVLGDLDTIQTIEEGFIAYSQGRVVVPPVGELLFESPPGDAHIKYGYVKGDEYYVIKLASGFYNNLKLGISPTNGLMLLFKQETGQLAGILLDEGHLTNVRTAAAGAVVAKHLAPKQVECIGIFGAGIQARMQLQYLKPFVSCKKVMVWGVNEEECLLYKSEMEKEGYDVSVSLDPEQIGMSCNLIVMTTPAKEPILAEGSIRPGTHITAMGSDTLEKQELAPGILAMADVLVGDSLAQCKSRGEIFKAVSAGAIRPSKAVELGDVISGKVPGRTSEQQLTIADLTGVAVQDIQISVSVLAALNQAL